MFLNGASVGIDSAEATKDGTRYGILKELGWNLRGPESFQGEVLEGCRKDDGLSTADDDNAQFQAHAD